MPAPTIRRIAPIKNLGVFKDCPAAVGNDFLQYNLIYGFNGSGKTTLARILASLEMGARRPELPETGTFDVLLSDGVTIKSTGDLTQLRGRMLVFDIDFVEESFKWKEGTAKPVFYLGREQAASAAKLAETATKLEVANGELKAARDLQKAKERQFVTHKRDRARLIAEQLNLGRGYDATNLSSDYQGKTYDATQIVGEKEHNRLKAIINQTSPLPKVASLPTPRLGLPKLVKGASEVAGRSLGQLTIQGLTGHEEMRGWLSEGSSYHIRHDLETCLLCGNKVTRQRLDSISKTIDEGYQRFQAELQQQDAALRAARNEQQVIARSIPSVNDVSQTLRSEFSNVASQTHATLDELEKALELASAALSKKRQAAHLNVDTSKLHSPEKCEDIQSRLQQNISDLNGLLIKHNAEFDAFEDAKQKAIAAMKNHYLAEGQGPYGVAKTEAEAANTKVAQADSKVRNLVIEQEKLAQDVKKHGPAAKVINKLIHNYLGRKDIELVTKDDGYELNRNGKPIKGSLSEGEKTAIALCYFLSTVEAEGRKRKDLIVVIDDPVSSLDTQALNYAFSILKSALSDAGQLFLLTHNLNFMNEAKKWLKSKTEKEAQKRNKPGTGTACLTFLDAVQVGGSETRSVSITEMPKYIRDYESEYHYLFHLVLKFVTEADGSEDRLFVMPNALRKLLETFLAFKLPGPDGLASKIDAVARMDHGLDAVRIQALGRLAHIESHGDSLDDLVGFSSMTVEEAKQAGNTLLELMNTLDKDHLKHMRSLCA